MRDALYSRPPENIVDTPATRRDMASFKASARSLDQGVGTVLNALEEHGLVDNTLVILTTDHGLAFPDAKATMFDRGIGVLLLMRGPGGFDGRPGHRLARQPTRPVSDDLRRRRDRPPDWLEGTSLLPLVRGEVDEVHDEIFAEVTYHAAYEPQRAVRTTRYKYVRRYDDRHPGRVLRQRRRRARPRTCCSRRAGPRSSLRRRRSTTCGSTRPKGSNRIDDPALADVARRPAEPPARLDGPHRRPVARRTRVARARDGVQHRRSALGRGADEFRSARAVMSEGQVAGRRSRSFAIAVIWSSSVPA